MKKAFSIFLLIIVFASCGNGGAAANKEEQAANGPVSHEKANPNPEPVATFSENIMSEMGRLNHWKFTVALYETHQTFTYRLQIQYAELSITDSLQFPDLGFEPKPALQKGKEDYSCIVGFFDNQNVFRDYKIIQEEDGDIRIHTLKRYGIQHSTI